MLEELVAWISHSQANFLEVIAVFAPMRHSQPHSMCRSTSAGSRIRPLGSSTKSVSLRVDISRSRVRRECSRGGICGCQVQICPRSESARSASDSLRSSPAGTTTRLDTTATMDGTITTLDMYADAYSMGVARTASPSVKKNRIKANTALFSLYGQTKGQLFGPSFDIGDTVGCGVWRDMRVLRSSVFFTNSGDLIPCKCWCLVDVAGSCELVSNWSE